MVRDSRFRVVVRRLRADSYKGAMPAAVMQTRKCIFSQHVHLSRPPYRHFERSREIFLALRFSDICILRFTACNRDPSTSLGMTIRGSDVSESLVPSHQSPVTKISHRKDIRCDHVDDEHDEKKRSGAFSKAYRGKSGS